MNNFLKYGTAALTVALLAGCGTRGTEEQQSALDARSTTQRAIANVYGINASVDYARAGKLLFAAADAGDPAALFYLGEAYRCGIGGVAPDAAKSLDAYQRAIAGLTLELKNNPSALAAFVLGEMAVAGHGMAEDPAVAAALYKYAAEKGMPQAKARLGALLAAGRGVAVDLKLAEQLLQEASTAGVASADYELYKLYTARQETAAAQAALSRAAGRAYGDALYIQALADETAGNERSARKQMEQAAESGSGAAAFYYAKKYARTAPERSRMLTKAADLGNPAALVAMAQEYLAKPLPNRPLALTAALLAAALDPAAAEAGKLAAELDRETGLSLVIRAVWGKRLNGSAALRLAELNLDPVILAYRAGAVNGSRRELDFELQNHAEAFYLSNSFYRLHEYQMPLDWLKNIFPRFDAKRDALGTALQYTLAAGMAGDGRAEIAGAKVLGRLVQAAASAGEDSGVDLRRDLRAAVPGMAALPERRAAALGADRDFQAVLSDMATLLEANGMALAGDRAGAYALLARRKLTAVNGRYGAELVNFVNHFANPLLQNKAEFSRATGIAEAQLGRYGRPIEQKFFQFQR